MPVSESTIDGARLQLNVAAHSNMGQYLTNDAGIAPFAAQTQPTQPLALATQAVEFNHTEYLTDTQQTFTTLLPDQLDYVDRLTLVIGVPTIVNQTQNQVNRFGVSGGVASITVTDNGSGYDGTTANTYTLASAPSGGVDFTVSDTAVPQGVIATVAGYDIEITEPGYGYTSAPSMTYNTGSMSGDPPTFTTTLTSTTTGENYRYVIPSKTSGQKQAALTSTNSNSGTATNLGTAILVESDVVRTHQTISKAITGVTYPSSVDSIYHNSIDGGVQDIAAYFQPYCPYMLIESAELKAGHEMIGYTDGYCLMNQNVFHVPEGQSLKQRAHASFDVQQLKQWSLQANNLWYVDLEFWPKETPFPLAALTKTALSLTVKTKAWPTYIVNGSGGNFVGQCSITASGTAMKTVSVSPATDSAISFLSSTAPATTSLGTAVSKSDFSMILLMHGYMVGDAARIKMQTSYHRIPTSMHYVTDKIDPLTNATKKQPIKINTRLPVKSLHWVGYLESNRLRNDLSNFAGPGDPVTATVEYPQGFVQRPVFTKCQVFANNKPVTLYAGADYFIDHKQKYHALRKPERPVHIWSHYFCKGSPYQFQHNAYMDASELQYFELRVDPDPALFADNSAVLGLNGSTSGTPTVAGGQRLHVRVWAVCQNFIIIENGTARLAEI